MDEDEFRRLWGDEEYPPPLEQAFRKAVDDETLAFVDRVESDIFTRMAWAAPTVRFGERPKDSWHTAWVPNPRPPMRPANTAMFTTSMPWSPWISLTLKHYGIWPQMVPFPELERWRRRWLRTKWWWKEAKGRVEEATKVLRGKTDDDDRW